MREACLPRQSEEERAGHGKEHAAADLRATHAEHHAAHRAQFAQAELEPDREHEEHHAEFGEVPRFIAIGDETERVWPERKSGNEVAEQRGQLERAAQRDGDHAAREKQQHRGERDARHAKEARVIGLYSAP